jgi:DNA polymerase-4
MRKIIHIDMDAFFASVEQRDFPELKGKPVAVGYPVKRSVVAAASYEARKYGVRSAMPALQALQKCPHLVFMPPRFQAYKQVSLQIREIFRAYTDLVEPMSLDEAYLDVTQNKFQIPYAVDIAKKIKEQIWEQTALRASAGVSYNKFLAKIASDYRKPDGLFVIKPHQAEAFLEALPLVKFHGIGKVTAEKLEKMGLKTGADLKTISRDELSHIFGKMGSYYFDLVRGIDNRPVEPFHLRKSIGTETTFDQDLSDFEQLQAELDKIALELGGRIQKYAVSGRSLTLKIRLSNFELHTRSLTLPHLTSDIISLKPQYTDLLKGFLLQSPKPVAVRLLGLTLGKLDEVKRPHAIQLLFDFK